MNISIKDYAVATILFVATASLFAPTLGHALLQWDDQYHLTNNPFLQPDSPDRYAHFWREPYGNLYVPITYDAWAWLYARSFDAAGTFSPRLLHAANVVVHAVTSVFVYFVLRRLIASSPVSGGRQSLPPASRSDALQMAAATLGATFFTAHPLQVESVAWISEFRGLLAGMFGMAATLAYLPGSRLLSLRDGVGVSGTDAAGVLISGANEMCSSPMSPSIASTTSIGPHPRPLPGGERARFWRLAAASALLTVALLCKPSAAALPFVWCAVDRLWFEKSWRTSSLRLALPALLVLASLIVMRSLQGGGGAVDAGPIRARPLIAGDALTFYLGKLAWPFALCVDYSRTPASVIHSSAIYIVWIVPAIVAFGAYALWWHSRGRAFLTALAIFVAALTPVLGIVPFDFQRLSTVADRYAYVALLGPALLLATIVMQDRKMIAPLCVLIALLAWRSVDQQRSWRDDASLWQHAVEVNPSAVVATSNLADAAATRGDRAEAERLFRRVISLAPARGNGYRGLARLMADADDPAAALSWYERAVAADPFDALALDGCASMLVAAGRLDDAERRYREALRVDPRFADAWNNLAALLLRRGRPTEAIDACAHATALHPRHPTAWANLALASDAAGQHELAADALARHESVNGVAAPMRRLLGTTAMRRGDWPSAGRWLRLAIDADPADVESLNDLGQTLAALGEVDEAVATFERAVAQRPGVAVLRENLDAARRLRAMRTTQPTTLP